MKNALLLTATLAAAALAGWGVWRVGSNTKSLPAESARSGVQPAVTNTASPSALQAPPPTKPPDVPKASVSSDRAAAAQADPDAGKAPPLPAGVPGLLTGSLDDVHDASVERIAAKFRDQDAAQRRRAAIDISGILFGETQIPLDTKEGRLDPAVVLELKAELSWLQEHPEP